MTVQPVPGTQAAPPPGGHSAAQEAPSNADAGSHRKFPEPRRWQARRHGLVARSDPSARSARLRCLGPRRAKHCVRLYGALQHPCCAGVQMRGICARGEVEGWWAGGANDGVRGEQGANAWGLGGRALRA
ncbi:hypothetical protein SVAN01_00350 [Stagonosporopsis vannaccii]|nr:hypothetical protein SVAN01_00350 [Stagonosporopsis vannaccii]